MDCSHISYGFVTVQTGHLLAPEKRRGQEAPGIAEYYQHFSTHQDIEKRRMDPARKGDVSMKVTSRNWQMAQSSYYRLASQDQVKDQEQLKDQQPGVQEEQKELQTATETRPGITGIQKQDKDHDLKDRISMIHVPPDGIQRRRWECVQDAEQIPLMHKCF